MFDIAVVTVSRTVAQESVSGLLIAHSDISQLPLVSLFYEGTPGV